MPVGDTQYDPTREPSAALDTLRRDFRPPPRPVLTFQSLVILPGFPSALTLTLLAYRRSSKFANSPTLTKNKDDATAGNLAIEKSNAQDAGALPTREVGD